THIPFWKLGGAYHKSKDGIESVPLKEILKNVYHKRYMIRAQAAKALREVGALDEIEELLSDPDPRVRRAALDGMTDYRYWFAMGRSPIKTEQFSGRMLAAIRKMLADPRESWWVVDGALMALKLAPAKDIDGCRSLIMPWTKHSDWWLRESSFMALSGLEKDDDLYLEVVPTLLTMMTDEYHTQPRARMVEHLKGALRKKKQTSPVGKLIMAGLMKAVRVSEIKSGVRSPEGAHNVAVAANVCLESSPETAVKIAMSMRERFDLLGTKQLISLVATPNSSPEAKRNGLYATLKKQTPERRETLTDILYSDYRQELIERMIKEKGDNRALVDTIIDLTKLRKPVAGWQPIGRIKPADRIWRFVSVDPQTEKDRKHPREKKRFRDITLPPELKGWHKPGFDDSKWQRGGAPIGIGVCKQRGVSFKNNSEWGKGEFLIMRTTFELDAVDCDSYRLSILAKQGFHVYLNGHKLNTYVWWKDLPHYRAIVLNAGQVKRLKKGTNVLAAYGNVEYDNKTREPRGQMDLFIEGLRMADLK
ncbi:MAG: HEAT repeat domain-containing protein, partial [Planctomycetota bacterium]